MEGGTIKGGAVATAIQIRKGEENTAQIVTQHSGAMLAYRKGWAKCPPGKKILHSGRYFSPYGGSFSLWGGPFLLIGGHFWICPHSITKINKRGKGRGG